MCYYIHFIVDGVELEDLAQARRWVQDSDGAANESLRRALPKLKSNRPRLHFMPFAGCACGSAFASSRKYVHPELLPPLRRRGRHAKPPNLALLEQQASQTRQKGLGEAQEYASEFQQLLLEHPRAEAGLFVHEYSGTISAEELPLRLRRFGASEIGGVTLADMDENEIYWFVGAKANDSWG